MKKKNKKFLVVAIAAALSAATAVPALALENQFNGAFKFFYDLSNFSATGDIKDDASTQSYFVERFRLGYTAKADDHVKLVSKFELDYKYLGNSSYTTGGGTGGAMGADSVNFETKNLYLDINYPVMSAKLGMMPYGDSFKGVLFDSDMAGVLLSHDYANAGVTAGFFRLADSNDDKTYGKKTYDLFSLEGKYSPKKDLNFGASYYFFRDKHTHEFAEGSTDMLALYPNAKVHNLGLNAAGVVGPVALDGFVLKQFGTLEADRDAKGYAFNLGAKMPVAGGTLRSEFLYVSGGNNAFYLPSIDNGGTEGGQYYNSEMVVLGRDKIATSIDNAIIYDVNNLEEGVIMGTVGYDYAFSDKLSASANAGFAAVAKDQGARAADRVGSSDSNYLGTEINAETYYKLTANVTLGARAGYVFLGDYFASEMDNPYDVKLIATYNF